MKLENKELSNIASRVSGDVLPLSRLASVLERGANPNFKIQSEENTPAFAVAMSKLDCKTISYESCYKQACEAIELFRSYKADFNLLSGKGFYPLEYVVRNGSAASAAALLDYASEIVELRPELVAEASRFGEIMIPVLDRLFERGLSPDSLTFNKVQSALGAANEYDNIVLSRYLLAKGANVNIVDKFNATPLMYACRNDVISGRWEGGGFKHNTLNLVQLLLENGANPTIKSTQRKTAMSLVKNASPCDYIDGEKEIILELLKEAEKQFKIKKT